MATTTGTVDAQLYSRQARSFVGVTSRCEAMISRPTPHLLPQLYVLGHAAQARMQHAAVLIIGADAIGVETAKNVILMGVKVVSLHDAARVSPGDLGANFAVRAADVGGAPSRAAAVAPRLAALNSYVSVSALPDAPLTPAALAPYDVVVLASRPLAEALAVAAALRAPGARPPGAPPARLVLVEAAGAFGRVFCDFGAEPFVVDDPDGEPPAAGIVGALTPGAAPGAVLVTLADDARHGLNDGDAVTFREVRGALAGLCDGAPRDVRVVSATAFEVPERAAGAAAAGAAAAGGGASQGGVFTQVKRPVAVTFRPLAEMVAPLAAVGGTAAVVLTDFGKEAAVPVAHACFAALHAAGGAPAPGDEAAAAALAAAALARLAPGGGASGGGGGAPAAAPASAADAALALQFARAAGGLLPPLAAALGGVAAAEVIKAASGKFMPLRQWLYLDVAEALPPADAPLRAADVAPAGGRHDAAAAVVGRAAQAALEASAVFLVGAGAIGCEVLKNWALMGVGCGAGGRVTVTDMDRIERSNLSRQFLFRHADIGRGKSVTAAAAAREINPALAVTALEARVGPDTTAAFPDAFWAGLAAVATALDNVDARLYVDGRCVAHGLPLLESGTLGTKGNTQVVLPGASENYGASRDPPERAVPVCTLKSFPSAIEHTLQWAREWMEGELAVTPAAANAYLSQPRFLDALAAESSSRLDTLARVGAALGRDRPASLEHAVGWARRKFAELFDDAVRQLLAAYPPDAVGAGGEPFWSGAKRCPAPLAFSTADETHMDFIRAAAALFGSVYGLRVSPATHTREWFAATAAAARVPAFTVQAGLRIAANDKELEEMKAAAAAAAAEGGGGGGGGGYDPDAAAAELARALPPVASLAGLVLHPVEFDKDDDAHVALVTAASNLRARCYRIEERDAHASRGIAGKIIPAIATTTSLVAGLICLEQYKLALRRPLPAFRNCFVNLALPLFAFSEPAEAKRARLRLPPASPFVVPPPAGYAGAAGGDGGGGAGARAGATAGGASGGGGDAAREWRWTLWDRVDVAGPLTLGGLIDFVATNFGLSVEMVTFGPAILLGFGLRHAVKRDRLAATLPALTRSVGKCVPPRGQRHLTFEVAAADADGNAVELPVFRYTLADAEVADADAAAAAAAAAPPA